MMKKLMDCMCTEKWGAAAPLILRVVLGAVFAMHGWQKLQSGIPAFSGFLGGLGFPMPDVFTVILIAAELGGGILLILGLFTHWAAKVLALVAIVALVTVHISKGFFVANGGYEFILLILAATISLLITGPGKYSLDASMRKRS
jgi:putative oxidoreductase